MFMILIIAVLAMILLPKLAGAFPGAPIGGIVIMVMAVIGFLYFFKKAAMRLVVILFFLGCGAWLAWSLVYPMYQAGRQAMADGSQVPGAAWAAVKEAGEKAAKKLLPKWADALLGGADAMARVEEQQKITEGLCLKSANVKKSLLAEDPSDLNAPARVSMYCKGQGAKNFQQLKADMDAFFEGAAGARFPFITGVDPGTVNTPKYFECLHRWVVGDPQKRFGGVAAECYAGDITAVPTTWRLCVEMGIQVYWDAQSPNYIGAPLAREIQGCRVWAQQPD